MRTRHEVPVLRKAAFAIFVLGLFCGHASAQRFLRLPTVEVFGGYSYLRYQSKTLGFANQSNMSGWAAGLSIHIYGGLAIVGNASGHYDTDLEEYNFMAGPQYSFEWRNFRLTGHGLFGRARTRLTNPGNTFFGASDRSRAWAGGVALDFPLGPKTWFRVIQADYLTTTSFGDTQHNLRVSTGLIYTFGKH